MNDNALAQIEQSESELKLHFREQFDFIQKSIKEFDNGDLSEAKRISAHLRTLLHDTKNVTSLLTHLKIKSQIRFLNTAHPYNPKNLLSYMGLISMRYVSDGKTSQAIFEPLLNKYLENKNSLYITFNDWWEAVVIVDINKTKFKRKDIVLYIANKDGGTHVDKKIPNDYAQLSRNNSTGWSFVTGYSDGKEKNFDIKHVELFTLRQIAFEVTSSIQKYL